MADTPRPDPIADALAEAQPLIADRGWAAPSAAAIEEARRLLVLVAPGARAPTVQVAPGGRLDFEWEAAGHGWLRLTVDGSGRLAHEAVIGEDEFGQSEPFESELPGWAGTLLARLMAVGH
jgi:hypothetical protein